MQNAWVYEDAARADGYAVVCGTDEAGRGPLAGPVYAAAVILPPDFDVSSLDDSKKLSEKRREALYPVIREAGITAVASASPEEIDRLNILEASLLAMRRAIDALAKRPSLVLVDGNTIRGFGLPARCIVGGDGKSASIAAASVLAKVERDRYMTALDEKYPQYGFAAHKGYPTKMHYAALETYGPTPEHRRTFLRKLGAKKTADPAGRFGEDTAARFLESKGMAILERNYRCPFGEADILARDGAVVVVVEVKQRRDALFSEAADAVGPAKRRRLRETAENWLAERDVRAALRFDIVEVYTGPARETVYGPTYAKPVVRHIPDAFE